MRGSPERALFPPLVGTHKRVPPAPTKANRQENLPLNGISHPWSRWDWDPAAGKIILGGVVAVIIPPLLVGGWGAAPPPHPTGGSAAYKQPGPIRFMNDERCNVECKITRS